jgi:hypothetical protein
MNLHARNLHYYDNDNNIEKIKMLHELNQFILNEPCIKNAIKYKIGKSPNVYTPLVKHNNKLGVFIPPEMDSLFWCLYIMKYGEIHYEMLDNKSVVTEKKLKIEYVEKIRLNKVLLKTYKFNTFSELENNLTNDKTLSLTSLLSLCALDNLNIMVIQNKTYYELRMNDSADTAIIQKFDKKFGVKLVDNDFFKNDLIKNDFIQIENVEKPLKAISAYKVNDLILICNKLEIDVKHALSEKTKTKKELYEDIYKKIEL